MPQLRHLCLITIFSVLYDLDYGKITDNMLAHEDAITCMAWGKKSNLLVSGSSDCTVKIWKGLNEERLTILPCLRGELDHSSHVTCMSLDRLVSQQLLYF